MYEHSWAYITVGDKSMQYEFDTEQKESYKTQYLVNMYVELNNMLCERLIDCENNAGLIRNALYSDSKDTE